MGKRNKIRYQATVKEKKLVALSGMVYLRYEDEEAIEQGAKGDLLAYPYNDELNSTRQGDYYSTGFSGYFKLEMHDGKQWRLVILDDIFTQREHHFSKTECPIDTYNLCAEMLKALAGRNMVRTYREHYELDTE